MDSCRIVKSALVATAIGGASPALAGGVIVVPGQPTPVLVPPPEFIPAPITRPNGAPAPKIAPLPPLAIEVTPLIVMPVPPRAQNARKLTPSSSAERSPDRLRAVATADGPSR